MIEAGSGKTQLIEGAGEVWEATIEKLEQ